jgi:hypothetical protein
LVVLVAGTLATAASNGPIFGPSLSAEEGPYTLVLSPESPSVGVSVELDPGSTASLSFGVRSELTGEANETDILDPSAQDQARVGIEAFIGCTAESPCEEGFVAHFARYDDPPEGELEVTWYVDGVIEVTVPEGEEPSGSLQLSVAP